MRLIARNPSDDLALPRIRRPEIKALTEGEIARMLATATGTPVAVPLLVLVGTGMRRGELLGLRWRDIDLDGGTLVVAQTAQEAYKELHFKEPKTAKSRRRITLPGVVVEALRAQRTEEAKQALASPAR